jgi:2-methylcitrate dehydratase PrpD
MAENLTKALIERMVQIRSKGLSPQVEHQAKRCLLDYLGAAFVGAKILEDKLDILLSIDDHAASSASPVGCVRQSTLLTTVLVNGLSSHVAEMDDGVRFGMIHPGSPIISALLPAAEHFSVRGSDLLMGIVIGYETALRIAVCTQPSHYQRGYHPTATCGSIGAAVGLAAMLGLDATRMECALAAAAVTASGSLKVIGDDSELKPYNSAHAATSGVQACLMAKASFLGPHDSLAGRTGFLAMCSDACDISRILKDCDVGLWINQVYVKPYAACRHAHPAIEACLSLRDDPACHLSDIDEIRVITYGGLAGRHDHRRATCVASAKMSIPCSVAVALARGSAGINDFTEEIISDPLIREMAGKVSVVEDPWLTAQIPDQRVAFVEIQMVNGTVLKASTTHSKGEPENPMTDDDLRAKFYILAEAGGIRKEQAGNLVKVVFNLPESIEELFPLLRPSVSVNS